MPTHWDTVKHLLKSAFNSITIVFTVVGIVIVLVGGLLGPQPDSHVGKTLITLNPYRWYLVLACIAGAFYFAHHRGIQDAATRFYAVDSRAVIERVKSEICDLVLRGEELRDSPPERLQEWDRRVASVLAFYPIPSSLTNFRPSTRRRH